MKFKSNWGLILKEISYAIDDNYDHKLINEKNYTTIFLSN